MNAAAMRHVREEWDALYQRFLEAELRIVREDAKTVDEENGFAEAFDLARRDLLLFPAPCAWVLSEKFRIFRACVGPDFSISDDRHELTFFASIEADALRLAERGR